MKNFGEQFKAFRTDRGFKIKELVTPEVSESTLSRFERGQTDLGIEKLAFVLNKMGVSLTEWFQMVEQDGGRESAFVATIMQLYVTNQTTALVTAFNTAAAQFNRHKQKIYFIQQLTIANFYYDLTGNLLCSQPQIKQIYAEMVLFKRWDKRQLSIFTNTCALLSAPQLLTLSQHLLQQLERIRNQDHTDYIVAWGALLNAYLLLIEHDLTRATKLHAALGLIEPDAQLVSLRIRKSIINRFFEYATAPNEYAQLQQETAIVRALDFLNDTGNQSVAQQHLKAFLKLKHGPGHAINAPLF